MSRLPPVGLAQGREEPIKIVIVRDIWLTGFDEIYLHTMHSDKPMQEEAVKTVLAQAELLCAEWVSGGVFCSWLLVLVFLTFGCGAFRGFRGFGAFCGLFFVFWGRGVEGGWGFERKGVGSRQQAALAGKRQQAARSPR